MGLKYEIIKKLIEKHQNIRTMGRFFEKTRMKYLEKLILTLWEGSRKRPHHHFGRYQSFKKGPVQEHRSTAMTSTAFLLTRLCCWAVDIPASLRCSSACTNYQQHPQSESDVVVRPPPILISCYNIYLMRGLGLDPNFAARWRLLEIDRDSNPMPHSLQPRPLPRGHRGPYTAKNPTEIYSKKSS
jgi:hypothetical protein